MRRFGLALLVGLAACAPDEASRSAFTAPPAVSVGEERRAYIVVLERGANPQAVAASVGASPRHLYRHALNGFSAELPPEAVTALQRNPNVSYVEPDGIASLNEVPWGLDRIDQRGLPLDGNYTALNAGAGVTAYIIDTGIRTSHNEFGGRAAFGADFSGFGDGDCHGHGTHVAGTVGGTTYGVAKAVSLVSVNVFGCSGSSPTSTIIAGVDWVTGSAQRPAVANMSLGGGASQAMDDAVTASIASGITYAVAAGNSGIDACQVSPARAPEAITVGATDAGDWRASFSNYGPCLDLFAPGVSILSAGIVDDGSAAFKSGTSMASPHVSGAAALILSADPNAAPQLVHELIVGAATQGVVNNPSEQSPNLLLFADWTQQLPPPPPPPPPATTAVHVGDLDVRMTYQESDRGKDRYSIVIGVYAHGTAHELIPGVTVRVITSGGSPLTCVTGSNGACGFLGSVWVKKRETSYTVTVQSLALFGASYDSASNHDPDGDSNGTVIVVPLVR
jgi:subtilisin family serine protease